MVCFGMGGSQHTGSCYLKFVSLVMDHAGVNDDNPLEPMSRALAGPTLQLLVLRNHLSDQEHHDCSELHAEQRDDCSR